MANHKHAANHHDSAHASRHAHASKPPVYHPPQAMQQSEAGQRPAPQTEQAMQPNANIQGETTPHVQRDHEYQADQQQDGTQTVWVARPHMVEAPDVPEEAQRRHEESVRKYPELNLSKGEFVISAVRRHPIGLISIWAVALAVILIAIGLIMFVFVNQQTFVRGFGGSAPSLMVMFTGLFVLLAGFAVIGGLISTYVYVQNKFFLTNESVIQFIQISLFSRKEQTVSLSNIEDASYRQHGILQYLFDYGNIRLSTQGDETTYRFSYVSNPKHQIALLNNSVEAFKMGRPVMHHDEQ